MMCNEVRVVDCGLIESVPDRRLDVDLQQVGLGLLGD